jgi:hypothetical protein
MSPKEEDQRIQLTRLIQSPALVHKDTQWKNAVLDVNQVVLPNIALDYAVAPSV